MIKSNGTSQTWNSWWIFLFTTRKYCPSYNWGHARLPRHGNRLWAYADASLPQNMGMQYGTVRNLRTIPILPMQSRSQKLTLATSLMVTGSSPWCELQHRIGTLPSPKYASLWHGVKNSRLVSHGGPLKVDESTTGWVPYQQGTFWGACR